MTKVIIDQAEAERCADPPCFLMWWSDYRSQLTLIQHGDNPEAVLQIRDVDYFSHGSDVIARYIRRWVHRIHEWRRG